jgi:hypothetical protein
MGALVAVHRVAAEGGAAGVEVLEGKALRRVSVNGSVVDQVRDDTAPGARELTGIRDVAVRNRALIAGLGSGRLAAVLARANFASITVAEPDAAVEYVARRRFPYLDRQPAIAVVRTDARAALRSLPSGFDFVLTSGPDVVNPETASLFTCEFYELVASRLAPDGVLQQEVSLEHLSAIGLTSVLASVRASFETVRMEFAGTQASIVACRGDCGMEIFPNSEEVVAATFAARGKTGAPGWLDPSETDALLEAMAKHLGVSREAMKSSDGDMFLRYHSPYSFLALAGQQPESLQVLRPFLASAGKEESEPATVPAPLP